ncbi:hopanoid biosynthesis-associated protein HpnK [Bradyrhizobium sp. CCBAU 53415]|uniref:hopanoid biosynthesis-associated protein HpnK n=1 Tax=Bradyrhizobium sp. CCBAU 53415 TaxID=1325119 RepID=UPI0023069247|nr:hopanoid biosynthesis-associated protein HpnK [Bradyrhizobium sp. CCBAU 53415]
MLHRLVINADDFGLAPEINEAVESAHRSGALSAASLMVGGAAAADAVARAHRLPGLNVGLHLTLLEGEAVSAKDRVPGLLAADGRLRADQVGLALALGLDPAIRRQLRAEMEAQFEAFVRTGLTLDHVNAHKHFHLHPMILSDLLEIARRFAVPAIRIPVEPRRQLRKVEKISAGLSNLALQAHAKVLRGVVRRAGFIAPDAVFGLAWSGAFTRDRLLGLLSHLPAGIVEIYLHPATSDKFPGCAKGYRYCDELAALSSPGIIAGLRRIEARIGGYASLRRAEPVGVQGAAMAGARADPVS